MADQSLGQSAMVENRRHFMIGFAKLGLGAPLLPGAVWAQMEAAGASAIDTEMLKDAARIAGIEFSDAEYDAIVEAVNQNLSRIVAMRAVEIPDDVSPPFYFSPIVSGMQVDRTPRAFRPSVAMPVDRPRHLEHVAFWPVTQLAELIRTRAVSSVELTRMYLSRLHRHNAELNCVVTFLDDVALAQAARADEEIAAGRYKGPLHGIPWGAKDIMAFPGYKTTWGSGAYRDRIIDQTATVIQVLSDAGAVLLAKLTTGELAGGDQWFGGRTNDPWDLEQGSSGSSAGSASATAAGCVAFALGTETSGSILSPSARCGATGLRPTFGRVSRFGVMALSWTQDRIGPICRSVEDCALVMHAIARPDGLDLSVSDLPFNWDAAFDSRALKVGVLTSAFADADRDSEWARNDMRTVEHFASVGVDLVTIDLPDFPVDALRLSVESAVFHDEFLRSGRYREMSNVSRGERMLSGRFVPAVEYLQSQRLRTLMMQALAAATAGVDVYLAPSTQGSPRSGNAGDRQSVTQEHSLMANLACYPAVALPNGFTAAGTPTSVTFMGRPFGEEALLALAKSYQDATGFQLEQPPKFVVS